MYDQVFDGNMEGIQCDLYLQGQIVPHCVKYSKNVSTQKRETQVFCFKFFLSSNVGDTFVCYRSRTDMMIIYFLLGNKI